MDPKKLQIMTALAILLIGFGFLIGVALEFADDALVQWYRQTGYIISSSVIFFFAALTAIMLIADTRKDE